MLSYLLAERPFRENSLQILECINELGLLTLSYFLIQFSSAATDNNQQYLYGWLFIGTLMSVILVNILPLYVSMTTS